MTQLNLNGSGFIPRCDYCGVLTHTVRRYGQLLHKCGCPHRRKSVCQAHPNGCDQFTDIRNGPQRFNTRPNPDWPNTQLSELPGENWEDMFACPTDAVDESAGMKDEAA